VFRNAPRASGYFRTGYAQDLALIQTRLEGAALAALALVLALFPFFAGPFISISPVRRSSPPSARCR
jgi:hypothetical protein